MLLFWYYYHHRLGLGLRLGLGVLIIIIISSLTITTSSALLPNLSTVAFNEAFSPQYGFQNVLPSGDGKSVQISLDERSTYGSGFASKTAYNHGFFCASIKLPSSNYSAGIVVTFYAQNDAKNRDEIDFEFLGHIQDQQWVLQTNFYGNGSTSKGREERYTLPFDPSKDFHNYSILWTTDRIFYYVDDLPIREVQNLEQMDFPSKPMNLYGTIWDGSDWATLSGRYRVDLKYSPFVAEYSNFIINGCTVDVDSTQCNHPKDISHTERLKMKVYRAKYMTYSYCLDMGRYPTPLPECGAP